MINYLIFKDAAVIPNSKCSDLDAAKLLYKKHSKDLGRFNSIKLYKLDTEKDKPEIIMHH